MLRARFATGPTYITVCGAALGALVTDSLRVRIQSDPLWRAGSRLEVVADCPALSNRPTPPYADQVRIDSLVLTADSAYVRARSLLGWDGRGVALYDGWLKETMVIQYRSYPYHYFTVSGFEFLD
jgi:hypothetical protein